MENQNSDSPLSFAQVKGIQLMEKINAKRASITFGKSGLYLNEAFCQNENIIESNVGVIVIDSNNNVYIGFYLGEEEVPDALQCFIVSLHQTKGQKSL